MSHWGYVFLAYGIVWSTIGLYIFALKRRIKRAEIEIIIAHGPSNINHEQK